VGQELKREQFYQPGLKALNYTVEEQRKDGAFFYMASGDRKVYNVPLNSQEHIDHYHTGFVLRSLYSIYKITGEKMALNALTKGYRFYRDKLFENGTIPKLSPHSIYPVNIHSCSEAILCMSTLSDLFPDALDYARRAFRWTRDYMQDKDGHFYYRKSKFAFIPIRLNQTIKIPCIRWSQVIKIPYIRWGQAWMMRAMASLLSYR
jgi:rhamnogalacturonyl hydrolase YesR